MLTVDSKRLVQELYAARPQRSKGMARPERPVIGRDEGSL